MQMCLFCTEHVATHADVSPEPMVCNRHVWEVFRWSSTARMLNKRLLLPDGVVLLYQAFLRAIGECWFHKLG